MRIGVNSAVVDQIFVQRDRAEVTFINSGLKPFAQRIGVLQSFSKCVVWISGVGLTLNVADMPTICIGKSKHINFAASSSRIKPR
jgi:hypothetical protein